jgi:hypothetical protein
MVSDDNVKFRWVIPESTSPINRRREPHGTRYAQASKTASLVNVAMAKKSRNKDRERPRASQS